MKNKQLKLSFVYISHFSRYILPGAKRIATTVYSDKVEQVAFINPYGSLVVVVQNRTKDELPVNLRMGASMFCSVAPAESISTYVMK